MHHAAVLDDPRLLARPDLRAPGDAPRAHEADGARPLDGDRGGDFGCLYIMFLVDVSAVGDLDRLSAGQAHGIEVTHRNVLAVKRDGVAVATASLEHAIVYGKQVARIA